MNNSNPAMGPRIYRAAGFWKYAMSICCVLILCGAVACLWLDPAKGLAGRLIVFAFCAAFAALGIYCLLWVYKARILLSADQITIDGPLKTTSVSLDQLRGWRILPTAPATLVLELKGPPARKVKVSLLFPLDEEFSGWLDRAIALDAQEAEASQNELATVVANDPKLGDTPHERAETLRAAQMRARVLNNIGWVSSLLAIFYPRPYTFLMLLLAALPWVAVETIRRSNGLIRSDEYKNDAHPNVAYALIFPPLALLLRAVLDFTILYSSAILLWTLAVAAVLTLAICLADPAMRAKKASPFLFFSFFLAYSYGTAVQLNAMRDSGPRTSFSAHVKGKHIDSGKHTSYNIELGPWGPRTQDDDIDVGKTAYAGIPPGSDVTVVLRHGWLGIQWYYIAR